MVWLPSNQIVVLEKAGTIRIGSPGGAFTTAYDRAGMCTQSERGLLGFAPDPAFLSNGPGVRLLHARRLGCAGRLRRTG